MHMLVSKIKPCMCKYKPVHGETVNGSLNQLWFHGVMVSTLDFESSDPSSNLSRTSICSQLNVQVQWCMTVSFGDQSAKAEKS